MLQAIHNTRKSDLMTDVRIESEEDMPTPQEVAKLTWPTSCLAGAAY